MGHKLFFSMQSGFAAALALIAISWANTAMSGADDGRKELEARLERDLFCNSPPVDAREAGDRALLMQAGAKISNKDPELINLEYVFQVPLHVLGNSIDRIYYIGDSGSVFYARSDGDLRAFVTQWKLVLPNQKEADGLGWGKGQYLSYSARPTSDDPFPSLIFAGRQSNATDGKFFFGCQMFDG